MKKTNLQELFLYLFILFVLVSAWQRWFYKGHSVSTWYKGYSETEFKYRSLIRVNSIIQDKQRKILHCMWEFNRLDAEKKLTWNMEDYCTELAMETSESSNAGE